MAMMQATKPFLAWLALLGGGLLSLPAAPVGAEEIDHARRYISCMAQAQTAPGEALESALAWRDMGGGDAAKHCIGAALMGLKQYGEAARRFEMLAREIKAEPDFKAALLGHAAQAWLLEGAPELAEGALIAALKLIPLDTGLLVDLATARAALGDYAKAAEDLDKALALDPSRADAYVFRASARRYLGRLDEAEADAERALEIDLENTEGLLERGIIRRLKGDDAGARRDWLKLLTAAPGTPAAEAARANLEKMDVKTD